MAGALLTHNFAKIGCFLLVTKLYINRGVYLCNVIIGNRYILLSIFNN